MDINISVPGEFSERAIKNLNAIISSKGELIAKACGADSVSVSCTDTLATLSLVNPKDQGIAPAASALFTGVLGLASRSKWISPKAKPTENERYTFRVFLVRCGLGGDAFHEARTALLSALPGDSAYLHGRPQKGRTARYYSVLRPVSIGTYPKSQEVLQIVNFDERQLVPEIGREAWGYIDYAAPLSEAEALQYDLVKA